jgi:hypothetical protein
MPGLVRDGEKYDHAAVDAMICRRARDRPAYSSGSDELDKAGGKRRRPSDGCVQQ